MQRRSFLLQGMTLPLAALVPWQRLAAAGEVETLGWERLKPPNEDAHNEAIFDAMTALFDQAEQPGASAGVRYAERFERLRSMLRYDAVPELAGRMVRIPGYIVPLDRVGPGGTSDFLLVPYFGACLHLPAPNPNQIVRVRAGTPQRIERLEQAYWVEGRLNTQRFQSARATTRYSMTFSRKELYRGKTNPYSGPLPHANGE